MSMERRDKRARRADIVLISRKSCSMPVRTPCSARTGWSGMIAGRQSVSGRCLVAIANMGFDR